nr:hypothetical protein [Helicobacter pylori]
MALHCKLLRCFRVNLWGGHRKGLLLFIAFYDFLVSKALKNQYGYLLKIKAQFLQAIELTNNSTQTSL